MQTNYFLFFELIGDLPNNLFSESMGLETPKTVVAKHRRRNDGKSGGGGGGKKKYDMESRIHESFESKNKAVEFSVFCETGSNFSNNLCELKQ